jgi:two-component system phosphate regulon response regulator PhoB
VTRRAMPSSAWMSPEDGADRGPAEDTMQPHILIIEDEPAQLEVLIYNLRSEGFHVSQASDGDEGLLQVEENHPDVIILDWMLPGVPGIEICRRLKSRRETKDIPIIMLTARSEEADRVRGLETGADDYVAKPYSVAELVARVRASLRRSRPGGVGEILSYDDITLDPEQHKATRNGRFLKMGPTEYRLLQTFLERPGRVWSREQLLDRVWGRDAEIDLRTVDVHIGRLRKALNMRNGRDVIRTVRGAGYSMDKDG